MRQTTAPVNRARVGASKGAGAARLFFILSILMFGSIALPATAQHEGEPAAEDSTLTWSVRPTPSETEPERPNFSYDLEPGVTIRDSIRVRNFGQDPLPLVIYASDALTTLTGALDLLPAGQPSVDVGTWITLESANIVVPGQGFVDVPFEMVVPANAESGDHTGGIVTSFVSPSPDGQPVIVDRRLGSRVQIRVAGDLEPSLEVTGLVVDYHGTPNPFSGGTLAVGYTVTNTGNVRLGADQMVDIAGLLRFGSRQAILTPMPELLPGNSLQFEVELDGVWPTFRTEVTIQLAPVATRDGDDVGTGAPATATTSIWTIPWPQLALLLLVAVIPLWVVWSRKRRREREEATLRQAVQMAVLVQEALQARQSIPSIDHETTNQTGDER